MREAELFDPDHEVARHALRELLFRATACFAYTHVEVDAIEGGCVVRVELGTTVVRTVINLEIAREQIFVPNGIASAVVHGLYEHIMSQREDGSAEPLAAPPSPPGNAVESSIADSVLQHLREQRDVHLVGPSASGKSIAASQVVARLEQSDGWQCHWVDLSDPSVTATRLLASVLGHGDTDSPILTVIDDVQGAPATAVACMSLIERLRSEHGLAICVLLVGWPASVPVVRRILANLRMVAASSATVLAEMLNTPGFEEFSSHFEEIERVSGGDLVVARAMMEYMRLRRRVPDRSEVAEFAVSSVGDINALSVGALRLLHWLACMGVFEIEVEPNRVARTRHVTATDAELRELLQSRWIRHMDRFPPHGSLYICGPSDFRNRTQARDRVTASKCDYGSRSFGSRSRRPIPEERRR